MDLLEEDALRRQLARFRRSEEFYPHRSQALVYTAGVKFLAERCRLSWLVDVIAVWQWRALRDPDLAVFQLWNCTCAERGRWSSACATPRTWPFGFPPRSATPSSIASVCTRSSGYSCCPPRKARLRGRRTGLLTTRKFKNGTTVPERSTRPSGSPKHSVWVTQCSTPRAVMCGGFSSSIGTAARDFCPLVRLLPLL